MDDQTFFDERQTSEDYFKKKIGVKCLQKWRLIGGGPPFIKAGRKVLYRKKDLDEWVEERKHQSTAAAG